ncbi:MAG TPA: zinc-dependent alcohol dehydrogenase family protein [Jatrophihabitantaceae bacterium]
MRAVRYDRFGESPVVCQVDDPQCPVDGAIIEVAATGLCRSDWHGWMGHDPDIRLPHVPGHEFAGTVVQLGDRVSGWRVGQRVTVPFVCACGSCPQCRRGDHQVCSRQTQPGFSGWGSFAERVGIDHADVNLVELPDQMPFAIAAALGCRFATAYRAVIAHARPAAGDWLAVHGCGGVGLSAIMVAAAHDVRTVAVDVADEALRLAQRIGATVTVRDEEGVDVVSAIREVTHGGVHASIDALGSAKTCRNSIGCLRPRGRHVQVGLFGSDRTDVPMGDVISRELEVYGSHGMAAHDYPQLLDEITSGRLRPQDLIGDIIGLDDIPAALAAMTNASPVGVSIIKLSDR